MTFTEEDIPLMKLIFNPTTHDMGMLIGRERADEIFDYVCDVIDEYSGNFIEYSVLFYQWILNDTKLCNFFWDNNILQMNLIDGDAVEDILCNSPITEKILDSGKLDLTKLEAHNIYCILRYSSIAKKIWDSGKLNLSLLSNEELEKFKQKFESI